MTTSHVELTDALGRTKEIVVGHSPLAAPDHVVEMARAQAGLPAEQMRTGEVVDR